MLHLLGLALLFPCAAFGSFYRADLSYVGGGGVGYTKGYTTLEAFFAGDPEEGSVMPFLDARGHLFDNGKGAANGGIGLRTLCGDRVYGVNAYYDYRDVGRFRANQVGIGFETLGGVWDFRLNGYLPVGNKVSHGYDAAFRGFAGNQLLLTEKYQSAMKGANAEIGLHLGEESCLSWYGTAGAYYFTGHVAGSAWGGNASFSGTYNEMVSLEISDSYDRIFGNNLQAKFTIGFAFGPGSDECCSGRSYCSDRIFSPVRRQEIIVSDTSRKKKAAIDPLTNQPYRFVFVNNTSQSDGTYESPYHSLAQAESNSSPYDVIYVYPGDGTTTGMDSGIALKAHQKFWGSGTEHLLETAQGVVSIPAQSRSSPTITNTNVDTEGNAITIATHNAISGFTIASALNDAIYGTDPVSLEVSSCRFENTTTYPIEALCTGNTTISITNNQFVNNQNGVSLSLNGTSNLVIAHNAFEGQTSVSNTPIEIAADSNSFTASIANNVFTNNTTGSIRCSLTNVVDAQISVLDNVMTNNGTGAQSSLGSNFVVLANGTTDYCAIALKNNEISGNSSNALYMHTSGSYGNLEIEATSNTFSSNGGSALVLATPADRLSLLASDNAIAGCNDNGMAVIASGKTTTGSITIQNNTITNIGNASNGIAINQDFAALNLAILNNTIDQCEGTGIISYAPTGIDALSLTVADNAISQCQNLSSNGASALDIEQYTNLQAAITDNTLTDNAGTSFLIGSTLPTPNTCLTLTGNDNTEDYLLTNPGDGLFNLAPCDAASANTGTITTSGTITTVQSCPDGAPCAP